MNETVTITVTTQIFGLGGGRPGLPTLVELRERTVPARTLIAEHVAAELRRVAERKSSSLALHYMLADDVAAPPAPTVLLEQSDAVAQACAGLAERRYVLLVDGQSIDDLDVPVTLTERSHVSFVRLLPLVGG